MSLLDRLFGGLFDSEEESEPVEHPCSNCPSSCTIAPEACQVCRPYKEQMIEAIYRVEHKNEIISQYEVTGINASEGTVVCPNCGGHSENHYVCDYCGSKLQDGSGKIQVASAADIPNPVLEAQDIIFKRFDAVKGYAGDDSGYGYEDALSGIGSQGLFSSIFSALLGGDDDSGTETKSLGKKMTEKEIEEMAAYYKVSVSDYLTGLDNGKYLTLSNKATAAKAEENYAKTASASSSSSFGGSVGDLAGLAGAMGLGSMLFGGSTYNMDAARKPYHQGNAYMQQKPPYYQQAKPQTAQNADPRLKNPGAGNDLRASQIRKEAEAKKAEQARREAQERARKEAQAKKAAEAKKAEQARKAEAAKANDRLDSGKVQSVGRREASAPKQSSGHADDKVGNRPQSLRSFTESKKDANAKVPGNASGMGRRPERKG